MTAATKEKGPKLDQGELAGVRPKHVIRLEKIENRMEELKEEEIKIKEEVNKLSDEAVSIWKDNKLDEVFGDVHRRGSNEWYVQKGSDTYKRRRVKEAKKKSGEKKADVA